jgi:hypothetical protein
VTIDQEGFLPKEHRVSQLHHHVTLGTYSSSNTALCKYDTSQNLKNTCRPHGATIAASYQVPGMDCKRSDSLPQSQRSLQPE